MCKLATKNSYVKIFIITVMLIMCALFFIGCNNNALEDATPREYIIQYTDDNGTHQITVTVGMPYSLEAIPTRKGYIFTGLYDAEVGGTQYISSTGSSLTTFNDEKNIILFPQFKAKKYNIVLDYQGAIINGERQLAVSYGSSLPELPKNLVREHKVFTGWYTEANCEGLQVADECGLIPVVSVLNDINFDLSNEDIYIYAGFEVEKYTVTCCFEPNMEIEEIQVEYDTSVSQISPKTRVNGKAPLTWSKTNGGEVFDGKIIGDMVLYAVEYAPVIEFDSNGGSNIIAVVARAGSAISLPTPTKDMAEFEYWEDAHGNKYTSTTMPNESISLKAIWQAKLVFDSNGGLDVSDISTAAGDIITLPIPKREGYIFSGWYTIEREKYTSTVMPSVGVLLKAGWYKEKSSSVVKISSTEEIGGKHPSDSPNTSYLCYEVDYGEYFNDSKDYYDIRIEANVKLRGSKGSSVYNAYVNIYNQKQVSSNYLVKSFTFENISDSYKSIEFDFSANINDNLYLCFYSEEIVQGGYLSFNYLYLSDFYFTIYYPDTTKLYL